MTVARLHPDDLAAVVEATARRVVALLEQEDRREPTPAASLVDAAEVARRFNVSAPWARQHADELGAVRLGTGPKARLRFDPQKVEEALTARPDSKRSDTPDRPVRRRRSSVRPATTPAGCPLLPVAGLEA